MLIKPYFKKFILQTHPDYFHNEKIKKQTNAASLQALYNIFQPQTNQPSCSLQFFLKKTKKPVTFEFDQKDTDWDRTFSFLSLCQSLGIPISQSDTETVQNEINKQNKTHKSHKPLAQEFADQLYKQHSIKNKEWATSDLLNNPLILFDTSIQKNTSAEKLCQWLPELQPELWWNKIPLIVVSSKDKIPKDTIKDVLVIGNDMSLDSK